MRGIGSDMTLRARLFDAFASRPRPTAERIVRPQAGAEGARVRDPLARRAVSEISVRDVTAVFEGNLWMLTRDAFLYYLPALMHLSLTSYETVSVFASELVGALTEPSRDDIVASLDRFEQLAADAATRNPAAVDLLRGQQLEWFDSGTPTALFRERFDDLRPAEGGAVLAFLEAFRAEHAASFPFGELDAAIDRYWARFRQNGHSVS